MFQLVEKLSGDSRAVIKASEGLFDSKEEEGWAMVQTSIDACDVYNINQWAGE